LTPQSAAEIIQINITDFYLAFGWGVKSEQQFDQCGFAATAHTHHSGYFFFGYMHVQIF
jgi:hypothetical protein